MSIRNMILLEKFGSNVVLGALQYALYSDPKLKMWTAVPNWHIKNCYAKMMQYDILKIKRVKEQNNVPYVSNIDKEISKFIEEWKTLWFSLYWFLTYGGHCIYLDVTYIMIYTCCELYCTLVQDSQLLTQYTPYNKPAVDTTNLLTHSVLMHLFYVIHMYCYVFTHTHISISYIMRTACLFTSCNRCRSSDLAVFTYHDKVVSRRHGWVQSILWY